MLTTLVAVAYILTKTLAKTDIGQENIAKLHTALQLKNETLRQRIVDKGRKLDTTIGLFDTTVETLDTTVETLDTTVETLDTTVETLDTTNID